MTSGRDARVQVAEAMLDRDGDAIRAIRVGVFVEEQHVPAAIEMDDRDPVCLHVLASIAGEPVGTGRIDLAKQGKIGRVAVVASHRRSGVGAALMDALHRIALGHGLSSAWCHAQLTAVPFYERIGYRAASEVFDEAGIPHVKMTRPLP
jgi:predicted GNAT family N-acyltransferase